MKIKRKHQLDFFRGVFLIIITFDHFLTDNNVIKRFTYEFVGWITAAEGFVFLSGLTAGIIYSYKYSEKGYSFINSASRNRAWIIYKYHIVVFLISLILTISIKPYAHYWQKEFSYLIDYPLVTSILGIFLIYKPNVFDILPMYALFVLFIPLVISSLHKGYYWRILLVSCLLYAAGNMNRYFRITDYLVGNENINIGYFDVLCWQLLFVLGLLSGFLYYTGKTKALQQNKSLFYASVAVVVISFAVKNAHIDLKYGFDYLINKPTLGPLRIVNFTALVFMFVFIATKKETWFTTKAMCVLGKYSLEVFSFHILLMIIFRPIKEYFNHFYSIRISEHFYIYPFGTLMLFLVVLPALFLVPLLMKRRMASAPPAPAKVS